MVASSIPCKLSLCADPAEARAGDSHASSGIDVACPTTHSVLAIASPHELHGNSWPSSSTGTSSFCCNHQYSITAVTTSTGSIAERYAYTAYGQPTVLDASAFVLSSSAINNRYTYTGREWDATLGLHHFRARWKSPIAGRFLTRDPIGYKGKSFNLYQFVRGRALSRIDPSGLTDGFAYPVTICCGGKKYEFTSFDPAHGCCANKAIYEFDTECCESGSVVGKVTVWKCVRNSIAGRCFDYSLGWFTCPFGWRGRHSYVCLDGPDLNCWSASFDGIWGVYNPSDPFGDGDEGYTSSCSESKVCPSEKAGYGMSKNSGYNPIYNNCHQQSGNCWSFYW